MINKVLKIILVLLVLALGVWLWTVLFPKPEQVIRNRLNKLAKLGSFSTSEGNIARVAKVEALGRLFAENAEVKVEIPGVDSETFSNREELMQFAMAAKHATEGVKAEFLDMNVEMRDADQSAVVDLTLKAKVGSENDLVVQELKFTLKKIDGDWLITHVEPVRPLKP
jgi:hypothetical protein